MELSLWPDTVLVYPAGLHFLARLALGLGDTPAILALQCTPAPIGIAPSLPPHGLTSPAYLGHKRLLDQRPNIVIASPKAGSASRPARWTPRSPRRCPYCWGWSSGCDTR
ncbi:hypothetical protein ACFQ0B_81285 [Nonomuraea thailandensis]